jgi:uncharacterized membrane protein YhaH (DUF805 family)
MGFGDAIVTCLTKYVDFNGRASRPEFWWFTLFGILVSVVLSLIDAAIFGDKAIGLLDGLFSLGIFLPSLAVGARRLHDIGKSGWWQLIVLTGIGLFVLIYWWCQPATQDGSRFNA